MQGAQIELTDIQQFYKNETVLLTGGTGFIGKLLLEKILRALPIKKVFLLIRSKKNAEPATRLQTIFASPIFQVLKRSHPDVFSKVEAVHGDCGLPMLGMSQQNVERLQEEVSVIFHCAANVRFEEPIKSATFLNVRATKDLIYIARKLKKIKAFVYVGTAYSNSNRKEIKEQVYPAKISAENLIGACEALDEATLASINPTLIADWPNNYTFTKQVAEDYISREAQDIPICICRPSVVMATAEEPLAAFFDSPYSLGAFSVVNALGICRISYFKRGVVDLIPADYLVNECIAAGWHTAGGYILVWTLCYPDNSFVQIAHVPAVLLHYLQAQLPAVAVHLAHTGGLFRRYVRATERPNAQIGSSDEEAAQGPRLLRVLHHPLVLLPHREPPQDAEENVLQGQGNVQFQHQRAELARLLCPADEGTANLHCKGSNQHRARGHQAEQALEEHFRPQLNSDHHSCIRLGEDSAFSALALGFGRRCLLFAHDGLLMDSRYGGDG
ncbi:hypothetical protein YQE_10856, partial [Dendroctonus ponderosae]